MKRLILLLAAACLSACNLEVANPSNTPSDPATETFASFLQVDISSMTKTPDGVYYKDVQVGTGAVLTGQPAVLYTIQGFTKTGAIFANGSQATPVPLNTLVLGLQLGMQGMREGGQRLIVVPSKFGFGPSANAPVPPNSTLVYKVQLDLLP